MTQPIVSKVPRMAPAANRRLSGPPNQVVVGLADDLQEILKAPAIGLRGTMYATRTLELPFALTPTSDAITTEFGQEINYFSMEISTSRTQEVNNLISTATVRTPFLVRAIAFVMFAEFEQGALPGYKVVVPAGADDQSQRVPFLTGIVPPFGANETRRPASFRQGWDVAEFLWAFSRAYRLQMFLGGDLRYVDELLGHIGTIEKGLCWQGYGQAERSVADYIALCNARMKELGSLDRFLPITGQLTGAQGDVSSGVLPPVISTQIGGAVMEGAYASSFPVRPFVAMPGVPIDIQLVRENNENTFYPALQAALAHGGTVRYAPEFSDVLLNAAGNANASYACDVQFKYGRVQIGTILLGARITSRCCLDWYYNMGQGLQNVYEQSAVALQGLARMANELGLSGIPTPRNNVVGRPLLSGLPMYEPAKDSAGVAGPPNADDAAKHYERMGIKVTRPESFRNINANANGHSLYHTVSAP